MAKKQTRKSISVGRPTYDRLRAFSTSTGRSMSQIVEAALEGKIGTPRVADSAAAQ